MIMYLLLIGSSDVQQWNEVCKQAYLHGYSLTMYTSTENGYSLTTYTSTENGYSLTTYTSTEHALPHPLLTKQDLYLGCQHSASKLFTLWHTLA